MTSAVFASYVEEFESICAATGRAIAQLRSEDDLSSRKALQVTAESELRKADDLMLQMDLEARSTPKAEARALQTKAKACRSEVSALRASLKQAICTPVHTADSSHLGGSSGDEMADTNDQRARLLRMGERIHEGTSKLQQAHKTALEAEQIGISIMGDLHSQRQTITHAAGTLQRANEGAAAQQAHARDDRATRARKPPADVAAHRVPHVRHRRPRLLPDLWGWWRSRSGDAARVRS